MESSRPRRRAGLGRWAMLDVYTLALAVVMVKLGEVVEFKVLPGLWFLESMQQWLRQCPDGCSGRN